MQTLADFLANRGHSSSLTISFIDSPNIPLSLMLGKDLGGICPPTLA